MRLSSGTFRLAAHSCALFSDVRFLFHFHALLVKKGLLMSSGFNQGRNSQQCRDAFVSFLFPETKYCPGFKALYLDTSQASPHPTPILS